MDNPFFIPGESISARTMYKYHSFTGIAGPGGGSSYKPVGTLGLGISSKFETSSKTYQFKGNRLRLKERFSMIGLIKLLKEIEKH